MIILNKDKMHIEKDYEVVLFRNKIKEISTKIGMSLVNQTKLITAASELVRNMIRYADGGDVIIEVISRDIYKGIRVTFEDHGPGIKDIETAMHDGYSTGKSMGLGLPGSKRLVNEFDLKSEVGKGTTVTIIKWKNAI
jgi:serine/threonine-protein kinase RsbT